MARRRCQRRWPRLRFWRQRRRYGESSRTWASAASRCATRGDSRAVRCGMSQSGWSFRGLADMFRVLDACLRVSLACSGSPGGSPMGPLSDRGAGLLVLQEAAWLRIAPLRLLAEWPQLPPPAVCDEQIASARYVDDTSLVCRQHPGVPFSQQESSVRGPIRGLDMVIFAQRAPVYVAPSMPKLAWVLMGEDAPRTFRVPPFWGLAHLGAAGLRNHIRSRLSRWSQMQLARRQLTRALLYDMLLGS